MREYHRDFAGLDEVLPYLRPKRCESAKAQRGHATRSFAAAVPPKLSTEQSRM